MGPEAVVEVEGLGRMRRAWPLGRMQECMRAGSRAFMPDRNFWIRARTSLYSLRGSSLEVETLAAIVLLG